MISVPDKLMLTRFDKLLFLLSLLRRRLQTAGSVRPVTWDKSREVREGQEGEARAETVRLKSREARESRECS